MQVVEQAAWRKQMLYSFMKLQQGLDWLHTGLMIVVCLRFNLAPAFCLSKDTGLQCQQYVSPGVLIDCDVPYRHIEGFPRVGAPW